MTSSGNKNGFALFTLAIVLAVAGILLVAMLPQKSDRIKEKLDETTRRLKVVDHAIGLYYQTNSNKYPCPASRTKLTSVSTFGNAETCYSSGCAAVTGTVCSGAVNIGTVPTRTLGLSDEYMLDAWGNRFNYAIDVNKTAGGNGTNSLVVKDLTWTTKRNLPYYLFSSGPNGKGAFNLAGNRIGTCPAIAAPYTTPPYDYENCDDDANFIDDTWQISSSNKYYDDVSLTSKLAQAKCPAGVPGCTLWLDASDVDADGDSSNNPADGTPLSTWVDKSSTGVILTNSGAARPTYYSSTNPINSLPRVNFSSSINQRIYGSASSAVVSKNFTVFIVAAYTNQVLFNYNRGVLSLDDATNSAGYDETWGMGDNHDWRWYGYGPALYGQFKNGFTSDVRLVTSTYNGSRAQLYLDGKKAYDSSYVLYAPGSDSFARTNVSVSSSGVSAFPNAWQGDVAEIAVYNSKLSDSSRLAVECYLANKWGLSHGSCVTGGNTTTLESQCPAAVTAPCTINGVSSGNCACPGNIGGCKIWLKTDVASALRTSANANANSGDTVNVWCDASGNGNNATKLGNNTLSANSFDTGINAVNIANGAMLIPEWATAAAKSIFLTTKFTSTLAFSANDPIINDRYYYGFYLPTGRYVTNGSVVSNGAYPFFEKDTPVLLSMRSDGSTTTTIGYNGGDIEFGAFGADMRNNGLLIGPKINADIGEVVAYDRNLTNTERMAVEDDIASRSHIPTPHLTAVTSVCPAAASCPVQPGDCQYWFDGQDPLTFLKNTSGTYTGASNGDNVAVWCDKSGNNLHATRIGTGASYQTNVAGSGFSGLGVNLDGKVIAPAPTSGYSNYTIAVVYRPKPGNEIGSILSGGGVPSYFYWQAWGAGGFTLFPYASSYGYLSPTCCSSNTKYVLVQRFNGTNHVFNVNGVGTSGTDTPITNNRWGLQLGEDAVGNYGEVLIYNTDIGSTKAHTLECTLANKWSMCGSMTGCSGIGGCP